MLHKDNIRIMHEPILDLETNLNYGNLSASPVATSVEFQKAYDWVLFNISVNWD